MSINKGFTLIETLFVLMIICILSLLTMNIHIPSKNDQIVIEELSQLIYQAKMNSIVYKEKTSLSFSHYDLSIQSQHFQYSYRLPDGTYFDTYQLSFNESGNIKLAKKVLYYGKTKTYSFVFQVGNGSYYVQ